MARRSYALATVLFLPAWIFTVGAGLTFGLVWGTVVAICGATIGATLAFLISRYAARRAVSQRFAANKKFAAIDQAIGKQGWKMVALLRLSPLIPFNLSNYLYGLSAIELLPYILASFFGMLPGTLLYSLSRNHRQGRNRCRFCAVREESVGILGAGARPARDTYRYHFSRPPLAQRALKSKS